MRLGQTSSTTMEWVMSQLVKNPRVMKKVQAEIRTTAARGKYQRIKITEAEIREMEYFQSVVKETFRLCPPVPLLLHGSPWKQVKSMATR